MDKRQVARPVGADDQDAAARCPQNEMPHPVGWGYDIGGGGQPGTSVPPRNQLSPRGKMIISSAGATGFEPAISGLTGRHVKPLHYAPKW